MVLFLFDLNGNLSISNRLDFLIFKVIMIFYLIQKQVLINLLINIYFKVISQFYITIYKYTLDYEVYQYLMEEI